MLSSLPNATSNSFSTCTSALQKWAGCRHVSILLAFHKIRIPHEKYCKAQQHRLQHSWSLPFPLRLMRLHLLQKSCAALELLLFLVTVKPPSYTSPASAKDLLDFHSLPYSPPPSFPLQILAVCLTSSLFQNLSKYNSI